MSKRIELYSGNDYLIIEDEEFIKDPEPDEEDEGDKWDLLRVTAVLEGTNLTWTAFKFRYETKWECGIWKGSTAEEALLQAVEETWKPTN